MERGEAKEVEVKSSVLRAVLKSSDSIVMKIDSLLRDHYMSGILMQDTDLDNAIDIRSSTRALIYYLADLVEQTEEAEVSSVFLPTQEVKVLATLISAVSVAHRAKIGNSNLWDH